MPGSTFASSGRAPFAMLPARHLRDASEGGCLEVAYACLDGAARSALGCGGAK